MAGFQVAINGRFWVAAEVEVLRVSIGLHSFEIHRSDAGTFNDWRLPDLYAELSRPKTTAGAQRF